MISGFLVAGGHTRCFASVFVLDISVYIHALAKPGVEAFLPGHDFASDVVFKTRGVGEAGSEHLRRVFCRFLKAKRLSFWRERRTFPRCTKTRDALQMPKWNAGGRRARKSSSKGRSNLNVGGVAEDRSEVVPSFSTLATSRKRFRVLSQCGAFECE